MTFELSLAQDKRSELLAAYTKKYHSTLQLEHQPSEATLNILIKRHARKSLESIPLTKVTNSLDGRDSFSEPLKLGKHLSINLDGALKRRTSDFNASPEAFAHAVRVLLLGYALVSSADTGRPWCTLDAAMKHISTVENLSRISAKSGHANHHKIVEAEMTVRCEWTRVSQAETALTVSDIIEIVSQRFSIWPLSSDLKGSSGGKGLIARKVANVNPYTNDQWQWNNWQGKDLVR